MDCTVLTPIRGRIRVLDNAKSLNCGTSKRQPIKMYLEKNQIQQGLKSTLFLKITLCREGERICLAKGHFLKYATAWKGRALLVECLLLCTPASPRAPQHVCHPRVLPT